MNSQYPYQGIIKHQDQVICDFQVSDTLSGMAKITRIINDEYPNTQGELIDLATGNIIYRCHQCAVYD